MNFGWGHSGQWARGGGRPGALATLLLPGGGAWGNHRAVLCLSVPSASWNPQSTRMPSKMRVWYLSVGPQSSLWNARPPPPYLRGRSSGDNNPQGSGRLPTTRLGPCRTFRSWHDLKMSEPSFFSLLSPSVPGCEPGKRAPGARGIPGRVGLFSAGQRPLLPAGSLMWFVTHPGHPGGHGSSHPSLL